MAEQKDKDLTIAKVLGLGDLNPAPTVDGDTSKQAVLPMPENLSSNIIGMEQWARYFTEIKSDLFKSAGMSPDIAKAIGMPPSMQPFSRLTTMPDQSFNGILQWPGALPSVLNKIATEHIAAQMIIGQRVDDVLTYSKISKHFWKPGWRVETRIPTKNISASDLKEIREAETFIYNCNNELTDARERDAKRLKNFPSYLAATVRAYLMYDTISTWTDTALDKTIKAFAPLDPAIIRLINPEVGYSGDKKIFAVGMNEAMQVNQTFTREEIVWYVGNPRLDPNVFGYGYSRIEVAARLIESFSNAMELNMDAFNKNAIPPAILKLKGNFTQKQVDFLNRLWTNIRKGASKNWVFPVMKIPNDGDVEILNLREMKGTEVYYKEWMNMVMGALCSAFNFPPHRLGYKVSGQEKDEEPKDIPSWIDENDTGKSVLLGMLETVINEYLLWPKYPDLQFVFTGKSPKEDAREYEARTNAMTINERRALVDLPAMEDLEIDDGELEDEQKKQVKQVAALMGLCPVDPGLVGAFQSIVAALIKQGALGEGQESEVGNSVFPAQRDPARSAKQGHMPGVRRNSAAERKAAKKKPS